MSRAFFRSNVAPRLVSELQRGGRTVQVWTTCCIVTRFSQESNCQWLVNPSNPELSGTSNFPYFPRGGPVPSPVESSTHRDWQPLGHVSQWGGMEVGDGMMYSVSVVDGLVHQYGGYALKAECVWHRYRTGCPVGNVVSTTGGGLAYDRVLHTTPPFYQHTPNPIETLHQCYASVFSHAQPGIGIAVPLLGAGARGFPAPTALQVAAEACQGWLSESERLETDKEASPSRLSFGLLDENLAQEFASLLEER